MNLICVGCVSSAARRARADFSGGDEAYGVVQALRLVVNLLLEPRCLILELRSACAGGKSSQILAKLNLQCLPKNYQHMVKCGPFSAVWEPIFATKNPPGGAAVTCRLKRSIASSTVSCACSGTTSAAHTPVHKECYENIKI